jgi:polyisoprenoid-binding protein YceI
MDNTGINQRRMVWVVQRALLGGLALLVSSTAFAQQKLLPAQSRIDFVSKQMGVPVEGHFKKIEGQVSFNPAKPEAASIALQIALASATLGAPETEEELAKPDWFNTSKFPKAQFQSAAIKKINAQQWQVDGKLTIKGISHNVQVPVTLSQSGEVTTARGVFVIPRLAFKIGENAWSDTSMVANEVQVKFTLALTGVGKL